MSPLANEKGVTLLETLTVAVMAGVLLAAALPSVSSSLQASSIQSALRTARNHVRVVRSAAVARNTQARLTVSNNGTTLTTEVLKAGNWTAVGTPASLEGGVSITNVNPALVFTPQGTTNATTTITITGAHGAQHNLSVSILGSVAPS